MKHSFYVTITRGPDKGTWAEHRSVVPAYKLAGNTERVVALENYEPPPANTIHLSIRRRTTTFVCECHQNCVEIPSSDLLELHYSVNPDTIVERNRAAKFNIMAYGKSLRDHHDMSTEHIWAVSENATYKPVYFSNHPRSRGCFAFRVKTHPERRHAVLSEPVLRTNVVEDRHYVALDVTSRMVALGPNDFKHRDAYNKRIREFVEIISEPMNYIVRALVIGTNEVADMHLRDLEFMPGFKWDTTKSLIDLEYAVEGDEVFDASYDDRTSTLPMWPFESSDKQLIKHAEDVMERLIQNGLFKTSADYITNISKAAMITLTALRQKHIKKERFTKNSFDSQIFIETFILHKIFGDKQDAWDRGKTFLANIRTRNLDKQIRECVFITTPEFKKYFTGDLVNQLESATDPQVCLTYLFEAIRNMLEGLSIVVCTP